MKKTIVNLFYMMLIVFLSSPVPAFAQMTGSECEANTLGGLICNTVNNSMSVAGVITGLAYLFGLILGFNGIMLLKQSVENPSQVPLWEPVKRFTAGGAFFALPTVSYAVYNTVYAGGADDLSGGTFNGSPSGAGLDSMIVNLIGNIFEPSLWAIGWVSWIAGLLLLFVGISRILKSEQQGPAGPTGIGTFTTFITAGVLLSMNAIVSMMNSTVFGGTDILSNGVLQYTDGLGDSVDHVHAVISGIIAFAMILGWISVLRGVFMVRAIAEGNNQASMMAAVTHLVGGALASNLGAVINATQSTLGIDSYGIVFGG